jgi:hypothetical protein
MKPSKRVGRPAIDPRDPSVPCTVRLPSKTFADLAAIADRDGVSVGETIRRRLRQVAQQRRVPTT